MLRSYLAASLTKPEEAATAVFVAALQSSGAFRRAMLEPLRLRDGAAVEINTEVGTGVSHDVVDIELNVKDRSGLKQRAWIEVKVNAELAQQHGSKKPQLPRYRDALNRLDRRRPDLPKSQLAVLLRRADIRRERPQIKAAAAKELYWQDVADLAEECGRLQAGVEWRGRARKPDARLELANLDTLLWFLAEAERTTRDGEKVKIVGITPSQPLTPETTSAYSAAYRALSAVWSLGDRIGMALGEKGRAATWREWDTSEEEDEGVLGALSYGSTANPTGRRGWWPGKQGSMDFWLMPVVRELDAIVEHPHIWAGVDFDVPVIVSAGWRGRLEKADFRIDEDDDGNAWSISIQEPLADVLGDSERVGEQAEKAASWIDERLSALEAIRPAAGDLRPADA